MNKGTTEKYCIIGAGAAGLAVAKNFKARGIPFDCLEREDDLGGLWNIGTNSGLVYETTHFVSSREFQGFEDFPMPEDWPVYPSHEYGLAYLRSYAEHFGIDRQITFNRTVEKMEPDSQGWRIWLKQEAGPLQYRGVIIANGHHDVPRYPEFPGEYTGTILHSRQYRSQKQLSGERILVIGAGNSGCDIAVDAVHLDRDVMLSMRRGTYFVPNFTLGWPTDDVMDFLEAVPMPRKFRSWLYSLHHTISVGRHERFGLQKPDYGILEAHPTVNSHIIVYVSQGLIKPKPAISSFDGTTVHFTDGSAEQVDMIVYATGYEISIPFVDPSHIFADNGAPKLFLNIFHRDRNDLFAVGLVQANGSTWRIADMQAKLISNYIAASHSQPEQVRWFDELKFTATALCREKYCPLLPSATRLKSIISTTGASSENTTGNFAVSPTSNWGRRRNCMRSPCCRQRSRSLNRRRQRLPGNHSKPRKMCPVAVPGSSSSSRETRRRSFWSEYALRFFGTRRLIAGR